MLARVQCGWIHMDIYMCEILRVQSRTEWFTPFLVCIRCLQLHGVGKSLLHGKYMGYCFRWCSDVLYDFIVHYDSFYCPRICFGVLCCIY